MDVIEQLLLFLGSYGVIVTIPCALLIMRKWPRSRVLVATLATLAALFYGSRVMSVVLAFRAGYFDSEMGPVIRTSSIALGIGSLAYLATGIGGFLGAARARQVAIGRCRNNGKTTLPGEGRLSPTSARSEDE